ncbi:MAG: hypothetical protein QXL61_00600 [Archaeoglobaceae archaeon]
MFGLVLDPSSVIPCGDKSEEDKEAIREIGSIIGPELTVYFSIQLLKTYRTVVYPKLREHHPLPRFQAKLYNFLLSYKSPSIRRCKALRALGTNIHILERVWLEKYDVSGMGLKGEDVEVLRVAFAAYHWEDSVFLVTADRHFFEDLDVAELVKRYPEGKKIRIVKPSDQELLDMLYEIRGIDKEILDLKRRFAKLQRELLKDLEEEPEDS